MKKIYFTNKLDYLANTLPSTKSKFPDGSDIEIFKFKSLLKLSKLINSKVEKEHVTNLFWKNPRKFKTKIINRKKNLSNYKFSVDYKSDLILVKKIFKIIQKNKKLGTAEEIVNIIRQSKYLRAISKNNRNRYFNNRKDLSY